jgi:hypothetical protein
MVDLKKFCKRKSRLPDTKKPALKDSSLNNRALSQKSVIPLVHVHATTTATGIAADNDLM